MAPKDDDAQVGVDDIVGLMDFVRAWQDARTIEEVELATGLGPRAIAQLRNRLRYSGVRLSPMRAKEGIMDARTVDALNAEIERLAAHGVEAREEDDDKGTD